MQHLGGCPGVNTEMKKEKLELNEDTFHPYTCQSRNYNYTSHIDVAIATSLRKHVLFV